MTKEVTELENNMAFLMNSSLLKKTINYNDAVHNLSGAKNILDNIGLERYSDVISSIIKKAHEIDDINIEVVL